LRARRAELEARRARWAQNCVDSWGLGRQLGFLAGPPTRLLATTADLASCDPSAHPPVLGRLTLDTPRPAHSHAYGVHGIARVAIAFDNSITGLSQSRRKEQCGNLPFLASSVLAGGARHSGGIVQKRSTRSLLVATLAAGAMSVAPIAWAAPGHVAPADRIADLVHKVAPGGHTSARPDRGASGLKATGPSGETVTMPTSGAPNNSVVVASSGRASLSISLPAQVNGSAAVVTADGTVVYENTQGGNVAVAVQALSTGGVSIQTILASADSERSFTYSVQGGITPELRVDGGLDLVAYSAGVRVVVGEVDAPWAFDANKQRVPTRYTISGNQFTQVVDVSANTTFPVVADPTYGHTYLIPTAYLNKSETRQAAGDTNGMNVLCAAIGLWNAVAGVLCAANVWSLNSVARQAVNQGKCMKMLLGIGDLVGVKYAC
jgi:hypothetical protein